MDKTEDALRGIDESIADLRRARADLARSLEDEETVKDEKITEGESESQNPVEWAVMLRGAETMLHGVGRANAFKEMADRIGEPSMDGWTAQQLGRYMAAYVRDVMQEEVATSV